MFQPYHMTSKDHIFSKTSGTIKFTIIADTKEEIYAIISNSDPHRIIFQINKNLFHNPIFYKDEGII